MYGWLAGKVDDLYINIKGCKISNSILMELKDLRHLTVLTMALIFTLAFTAPGAYAADPSQLQTVSMIRTIHVEPAYQVYIDEVTLSAPSSSHNITFLLPTPGVIFEAKAYGPQNQSLTITRWAQTTNNTFNGNLTLSIDTSGFTTYRLVTIIQGMTYNLGNFSTLVNYFPILDEAVNASTTIYLPSGSSLVSYSMASLSNSSQGSRPMVYGTMLLSPGNSTYGIVTFSGNFSTVAATELQRTIRVYPAFVEFSETMTLINTATTYFFRVILDAPAGAAGVTARDTIGALEASMSGGKVNVTLRGIVYQNEKVQFTLVYTLPTSVIRSEGGRSVISGDVLPGFLNMPCDAANVTVIMPTWSTSPQMPGGEVVERYYGPVASAGFTHLTPYTNQAFSASYVPPSMTTQTVSLLAAIALVVAAVVALALKWRLSGKQEALPASVQKEAPKQPKKEKP